MKFRKLEIILVVLTLLLTFSCANIFAAEITLTWSSISVPDDAHTQAMQVFKEEVERLSDGKITADLYIAGQLYTQEGELAACREGSLDIAYFSASWFAEFVPYVSMIGAVYTFSGFGHMDRVLNGEIGEAIFEDIAQKTGVRPLGAFYLGTRQLNLVEKVGEVRTPEDMKGVKLRMPTSPAWLFLGSALGANPTPLAFSELYMALNSGTVDGQDNPLPTIQNAKFYEVTDQIILTNHIIDSVWPSINEELWQKMGPELQRKVKIAIEEAREYCDETNLKRESELVEFFKSKGLKAYSPDIDAFKEHVQQVYLQDEELTSSWDMLSQQSFFWLWPV